MVDLLADLQAEHKLLIWDRETAVEYMGLGQVQRMESMKPGESLTQETPFGTVMVFLVAGQFRVVLGGER